MYVLLGFRWEVRNPFIVCNPFHNRINIYTWNVCTWALIGANYFGPVGNTIVSDHLQFCSWQYIGLPKWDVARNKNFLFGLGNNQSMLCHDMRFKWTEHNKVERWFDHPCPIIGRFRFPRVLGFWTHDITSSCAIWRHAFKMKFRRWKQTWEQAFSGWPLKCGHDATFRRSCSGKRLSKPP